MGSVGRELSEQQLQAKHAAAAVQEHVSQHHLVLEQQRAELLEQLDQNQRLVHSFLLEELQQDVPTGMKVPPGFTCSLWTCSHSALSMPPGTTPRRQELAYPSELMKLQSRCELLETLRKQQEALQAALQVEEEEEDDEDKRSQVDHVSSPVFLWPFTCPPKVTLCSALARVGLSGG